jgi:putative transposase
LRPQEYQRFLVYLLLLNDAENARYTDTFPRALHEAKPRGLASRNPLVAIGAYCLMPNHFHLYVTPLAEDGISRFMQRVQTAYTMYFNQKHARTGALFQGTFKAQHVNRDPYAEYLFSYIHLNPAKLVDPKWKEFGAKDFKAVQSFVKEYPYSSLREYAERRHIITDPAKFPEYLSEARAVERHIDMWLRNREEVIVQDSRGLASRRALKRSSV